MSSKVPLPAGTTLGKSFEYGLDVNLGTEAVPVWQPVRRISGFQPSPTPTTQDAQTYDDLGAANSDVTGWSIALAFNVQVNRAITTGLYLPEIEAILARTKPTAKGEAAVLDVRWYHKPESGAPNPTDAGRGFTTVSYSRQNTGPNGEIEVLSVSLTGKGTYDEIANPFAGWAVTAPVISGVSAASPAVNPAGTGKQVTITGLNLTGATAVTIKAIAVTSFAVVSSTTIIAVLPTDTAGTVPVVVTTPAGVSAAVNYTRAA
ncbi:hypothetical protein E3T26_14440 [Cryobacterium sp. TMT1-21]|uniref:phage tail tube protein n=1 Tax=Cryobacterium sp. TMT1-21 TaxID=1259234 RepID=UPI00106B8660|nr:IPT/TIG domain-containing protein [Cryobacterium sp. TMT1-21]TFD09823.1 hypothetical protein E3T26_14440 [Cryobacterium sp. TMT1-21]